MRNDTLMLTEREKETLRLLASGHDAKSIARHLGLSVHTINERLRDARRKLEVSNSRAAARILVEAEGRTPDSLTDRFLGVAEAADGPASPQANQRQSKAHRLAWVGGGMIIMSLLVAALALSPALHGTTAPDAPGIAPPAAAADSATAASLRPAQDWLALLDRQSWQESWRTAAPLFKSQITVSQWAATIQSVRQQLGPVSARRFQNVLKAGSLPGAPPGDYEVIQFQSEFAHKSGAIETVTLTHDQSGWRVVGYFIR